MGGAELKMSRFRAGVIRYKVYKDHDVLVDEVHFPKGGKMQISPNLDFICTNQDQIRNQRFRLLGNSLYSDRKAGGSVGAPYSVIVVRYHPRIQTCVFRQI